MQPDAADFTRWSEAVGVPPSDLARAHLAALTAGGPERLRRRLASVELGVSTVATSTLLAGPREPMRPGLQRLVEAALGANNIWLIRWIMGRWPRGPILVKVPLADGDSRFELGIVAPITGTRIALSEGPVPFPQAAVHHFKAFDAATEAPGLLGCRVKLQDRLVTSIAGRWEVAPERLPSLAALNDLPQDVGALMLDVMGGLRASSHAADAPVAVEATWRPEAEHALVIEVGPVALKTLGGLVAAAIGKPAALHLVDFAKQLKARTLYRVRLRFAPEGLQTVTALAALPGDRGKGGW